MKVTQATSDAKEKNLVNKPHTPEWVIIFLLLVIMPVGLYFMFREKRYHRWFPILLWVHVVLCLPVYLIPSFFLPQLTTLYVLNLSYFSLAAVYFVYGISGCVLTGQVAYGFVLKRRLIGQDSLSNRALVLALIYPIISQIALLFGVGVSLKAVYNVISIVK